MGPKLPPYFPYFDTKEFINIINLPPLKSITMVFWRIGVIMGTLKESGEGGRMSHRFKGL